MARKPSRDERRKQRERSERATAHGLPAKPVERPTPWRRPIEAPTRSRGARAAADEEGSANDSEPPPSDTSSRPSLRHRVATAPLGAKLAVIGALGAGAIWLATRAPGAPSSPVTPPPVAPSAASAPSAAAELVGAQRPAALGGDAGAALSVSASGAPPLEPLLPPGQGTPALGAPGPGPTSPAVPPPLRGRPPAGPSPSAAPPRPTSALPP